MYRNNDRKLARYARVLAILLVLSACLNPPWSLAQESSPEN